MTDPTKGWPSPLPNPFALFGAGAPTPGPAPAPAGPAPFVAQGLASGMDLFQKFWGNLPGGTALPGFLVPTMDVAELDKRIADLRAAESWLDVNVNLLRATIQGLEVQRHTIAAIQSIATLGESGGRTPAATTPAPAPAVPPARPGPAASPPVAASPAAPASAEPPRPEPSAAAVAPPDASKSDTGAAAIGAAAGNWLGFMQDQFAKVAQAALAPSSLPADAAPAKRGARPAGKVSAPAKAARKSSAR